MRFPGLPAKSPEEKRRRRRGGFLLFFAALVALFFLVRAIPADWEIGPFKIDASGSAADPEASASFERMAFTHRKEYARWVAEAKRDETRQRRVEQAVEMIRTGQTRS